MASASCVSSKMSLIISSTGFRLMSVLPPAARAGSHGPERRAGGGVAVAAVVDLGERQRVDSVVEAVAGVAETDERVRDRLADLASCCDEARIDALVLLRVPLLSRARTRDEQSQDGVEHFTIVGPKHLVEFGPS